MICVFCHFEIDCDDMHLAFVNRPGLGICERCWARETLTAVAPATATVLRDVRDAAGRD